MSAPEAAYMELITVSLENLAVAIVSIEGRRRAALNIVRGANNERRE